MADYAISNVTRRVVYEADGVGPYSFTFEILVNTDVAVYKDDALLTLTTDYTVTINANGTGSITLVASPTGADQIAIVGSRAIQRTSDFVTGGDFFANTVNDELDSLTIFAQQNAEAVGRALQAPQTDPTTIDMTLPRASVRANKTLAFDSNGDPVVGEVIGDNRGEWAAGTAYSKRDIVKDPVDGNVYYAAEAHTSSGTAPISANADAGKWLILVDNASAQEAADDAETAATAAAASASAASTSATNAASSASAAATSASGAATSATNAASSATAASGSATTASTAATNAGNSATAAATSATNASNSASAASTSASNASSSASAASTSASNASTSATNAASSASTATTQASNASTSATNAASSASAAATSATNASNSASAAATSESNAAASAAAAATALDNFDDRYLGVKTADPTLDNDGNALVAGALYFNSGAVTPEDKGMRVYDGGTWIAASAAQEAALVTYEFVATAGQTTFTGNDANGLPLTYIAGGVIVALNGVVLRPGDDYTATNGSSIVLTSAAALNDELQAFAFGSFNVANTYTQAQADALLALKANTADVNEALAAQLARGLFRKSNPDAPAWTKTGAGTATTASTIYAEVNGVILTIASGTSITMPTLAAGTDYAIWCKPDGALEATSNHTSPPVANSRKVGGFHYAPGGNATGTSGGDTTAAINAYSFWDLKFKPNCADPRGMTLVGGGFWSDIYLTGVDAITNGSSKYNVTMADGSSPPKVPTMFGGNGSTTYGSYTWFEAMELATAFGKRCPTQQEFMSFAYGTTEASSVGSDQGSTILNAAYTSKWGVIQATGVLWVWGRDRGGPFASAAWNANTEGRGSEYNAPNSALFGGGWANGSDAGSRCSYWYGAASASGGSFGSRFVCDHLQLD